MRILLLLTSIFLCISTAYSESPQYHDVLMHNARTATATGTMLNVHQANTVRLDVQITGTATVSFQIAGPGNFGPYAKLCKPSNSETKVTSTTSSGVFYCQVAAGNVFLAPITAYSDGAVTVVGRASTAL